MPQDYNKDAYPQPPTQTPVIESKTALPNPALIVMKLFYYAVDVPVTTFRGVIESLRFKNPPLYYHKRFRRVPDLTECEEGDYVCQYEAEMQWKRDLKVDQEILKMVKERFGACVRREGESATQNCAKENELMVETYANYRSRYADLGAYATARRCLMRQKERMIDPQAQKA